MTPAQPIRPGRVVEIQAVTPAAAAAAKPVGVVQGSTEQSKAEAKNDKPEKSLEERKVEALLAAKFDRTLPAVLKAWSYKPPKDENKKDAKSDPKTPPEISAKVANAFEGLVVVMLDEEVDWKVGQLILAKSDDVEIGTFKILAVEGKKVSGQFQVTTVQPAKSMTPAAKVEPATKQPKTEEAVESKSDEGNDKTEGDESKVVGEGDDTKEATPSTTVEEKDPPADEADETEEKDAPKNPWSELKQNDTLLLTKKVDADQKDKKVDEAALIKKEVEAFTRNVTLGKWADVKTYLATFKPDEADKVYAHLLQSLTVATPGANDPNMTPEMIQQMQQQMQQQGQTPPSNFLSPDDILQLTEAAPKPIVISVTGNSKISGSVGDPISGKWTGSITVPGTPEAQSFTMTLKLNGSAVTGNITVDGKVAIENGNFERSTGSLTFTVKDGVSGANIRATVEGTKFSGTFSVEGLTVTLNAELTEPDPQPQPDDEPKVKDSATTATAAVAAPAAATPAVKLPPGVTMESLPPEVRAQIMAQTGGVPATAKPSSSTLSHVPKLATLIRNSKKAGFDFTDFIAKIKAGTTHFGGDDSKKKMVAADLLIKSGMIDDAEPLLPSLDDEKTKSDIVALKMWSQLSLSKYRQKKVAEWLNRAWQVNQALHSMEDINKADKDAAMAQLIELSPQIDKEVGEAWLNASFTESPERGMNILTNLGTKSSEMALKSMSMSETQRLKLLRLQNNAVENLLKVSPERADEWKSALTLLAKNWLTEASTTIKYSRQNSSREYRQYDMYGNSYWVNEDQMMQRYNRGGQRPRPIKIGDILEIAPGKQWQQRVHPDLQIEMQKLFANLHMRINEENLAFPYIEQIAKTNPKVAKDLVHEFLRIWTRNHDPNTDRRQRNPYIYFYGFDQKAESIPLTRSKQERNLEELTNWVDRIRAMNIEDLNESLLANAFTTCHSSAEVYDLNRVRRVFGDLGNLKPETVAAICEKMRSNLSSNWRDIRNQEAKQTKRREPEVQQEVLRGYQVAIELANEALKSAPENWQLHLALASLQFDDNAYSQSVAKSSDFTERRDLAFEQFAKAAEMYKKVAPTLEEDKQSTRPYDVWFYASLGAVDLGKITNKTQPDLRQYSKVRDAILQLPGTLGESHMSKFANNLFTRMNPIKPEIKFRYLRGGFAIVGDHPRAWEARNLFAYYRDLVSELKLSTVIDGNDIVGHSEPFGVFVNLEHTQEIERESGGFGKYVQNQNGMLYAYNYGRPTEDYRDKFTDSVKQALGEHFEVQSVTFQSADNMKSRPAAKPGWRVTPYAYLLLKPRGSEVDRIAPLKLDMDFMDTSGYVVIPIESPKLIVDCSTKTGDPRPINDLEVTQTLDERQAEEGKLIVEISATSNGLVPPLDQILDVEKDSFEVVSIDDQGVLPSRFDKESDAIQIVSERSWTVEYKAKDDQSGIDKFSFADSVNPDAVVKFKRYEDADLVDAEQIVSLEKNYDTGGFNWIALLAVLGIGLVGIAGSIFVAKRKEEESVDKFTLPEDVNPFTVLTLLQDIRQRNGISGEQAKELDAGIEEVERQYFGKQEAENKADLEQLARKWVEKAR